MSHDAPSRPTMMPRKEVVSTSALGELVVRQLKLSERNAFTVDARAGNEHQFLPRLLHASVSDKAGAQVYSVDEWDIFGVQHAGDTTVLVDAAMRLNGFDRADAKND